MKNLNILKTIIFSLCVLSTFLYGASETVFGCPVSFSKEKPLDYNNKAHVREVLLLMEKQCSVAGKKAIDAFKSLYSRGNIQDHEIIAVAMANRKAEPEIISSGKVLVNELKRRELIKDAVVLEQALSGGSGALTSLKSLLR